ncbi:molybdenum cofactor guanylyltransferase [Reinekea marinisedimentorum]|uniref:Molybdopterin-guanine dinucleotide biosynthesis protein A n=1 Tax=Reinekea marinisedimentorum TaxID=230495 RepID=A0A4R3I5E8_9GAMM|nr:molybdenum cofactor guanylyltransferase [Reinekea marinisedimentorum]TCS40173.1 molybdopterin-guanine dinucleotide biosynthesis protein A [Reinekea marinisedimentorum]
MTTAVLILSGGRSRRMGQDKAQLPLEGLPLLQWQKNRLQQAGFQVIHGIADNFPGYLGPLAGIEAALTKHPEIQRWLVLPVDMPSLSVEALHGLLNAQPIDAAVISYKDQPFPLLIRQPEQAVAVLQRWLVDANGRRSVRALIDQLGTESAAMPLNNEQFNNINTPEQWRQFKEVELT